MKNKLLYFILFSILAVFTFQACNKEDEEIGGGNGVVLTQDSLQVETRTGETYPIFYLRSNSVSYHQKDYQISYNKDSVAYTRFNRTTGFTKVLGTLDPSYSNKPARLYNVTVKFKDSSSIVLTNHWIKDTTAVNFTLNGGGPTNLFNGTKKVYRTDRTGQSMQYYDTNYKKLKNKFKYSVALDTTTYQDFIPATNTGIVFWLGHKM